MLSHHTTSRTRSHTKPDSSRAASGAGASATMYTTNSVSLQLWQKTTWQTTSSFAGHTFPRWFGPAHRRSARISVLALKWQLQRRVVCKTATARIPCSTMRCKTLALQPSRPANRDSSLPWILWLRLTNISLALKLSASSKLPTKNSEKMLLRCHFCQGCTHQNARREITRLKRNRRWSSRRSSCSRRSSSSTSAAYWDQKKPLRHTWRVCDRHTANLRLPTSIRLQKLKSPSTRWKSTMRARHRCFSS